MTYFTIDPTSDIDKLLEDGPADPQTWRDGHKLVDLGGGRPYALVEHKVRLIDPDDFYAALSGSCQSADDLAEEWEIPITAALDLIAKSEVEQCTTCGWWCDKSELEIVDDEPTCEDCREE